MSRTVLALAALLWAAAPALAHGGVDDGDGPLSENGEALMVGSFDAAQEGPLVIVPHRAGPLACADATSGALALGDGRLAFGWNGTALQAVLDVPANGSGAAGFAVDTGEAVRTLLLMREHAVALHRLAALVLGANTTYRSGLLGVPHPVGPAMHDFEHTAEGGGLLMDYDESTRGGAWCADGPGHVVLRFTDEESDLLRAGGIVHVVVYRDARIPHFLPRPIDGSTAVLQLNLYLARPGEDPAVLQAAFAPRAGAREWLPLGALALGLAWVAWPRRE